MPDQPAAPAYPTAQHVQRGPPDPAREPERAKAEKWCRVFVVVPTPCDGRGQNQGHYDWNVKGPFGIPMAVRKKGTDLGSRDAWIFFTHPFAAFHKDAVFWNAPAAKGVLEARLAERTPHGFRLFDEVGAGFAAERVTGSFAAAMGVFRGRVLTTAFEGPYAPDLTRLDIDVLECFRLFTLCLKTKSPLNALASIDDLLKNKNVARFFEADIEEADRAVIRQFGALRAGGTFTEVTNRFWVDEAHFTQSTDVKDGKGRQLILDLIHEWQRFEQEHGTHVETLGRELGVCDTEIRRLSLELEREKDASTEESAVTRFLTRRKKVISQLEADRTAFLARKKVLEAEYDAIPGYDRVKGLSAKIEGFKKVVDGVRRLATNVFDHNVSQQQIKTLDEIYTAKLTSGEEDAVRAGWKNYELRVRADVFPRLLAAYAISGYVLRRPDSLPAGTSLKNVKRINRMAHDVIEYFRDAKLGDKTLGEAFDQTWGQIEALEARI
jgi:hypothetical protein